MIDNNEPEKNELDKLRQDEFDRFLSDLDKESDRGVVLSASAQIELQIERVVIARLGSSSAAKRLIRHDGPLGSLESRIDFCSCLKLIDEHEHKALELISRLRNVFAHKLLIGFGDQGVQDRAIALVKHMLTGGIETSTLTKLINQGPRSCFTCSVFILSDRLRIRDVLINEMQDAPHFDFSKMNREIENILEASD